MAVSCPEVMYGAYYPYLYGRAGPSRSFYQYERFNQDLYSSSGVQLASSSASGSSHSPCSPILPPAVSANAAAAAVAAAHNTAAAVVAVAAQTANQSASLSATTSLPLGGSSGSGVPGSGGGGGGNVGSAGVSAGIGGSVIGGAGGVVLSGGGGGSVAVNSAIQHSRAHTKEEDLGVPRSDAEARLVGSHHNESSCSSSPDSPRHNLHGAQAKELPLPLDTSNVNGQGRAQYLSATCVVFTNYSGDTASVVDEHFSRALNFNNKDSKETSSPMSARNFPPSFWNSNYVHPVPAPTHPQVGDLYASDGGYATDPWVPHAAAAHYGSYAHAAHAHAAHAHAYHHNMAQYGSLLRLPQQYSHGTRLHHDQQTAHALESAAAYSSYPTMAGLDAQVQESSKDLYWF
ncbi:PREDICTED: protein vestigial isoform X2 [Bactrocera latifrons]|uniref:Protein vestigial n=1 Tax=Bactrocera latifrons TaxID=174628 RepID=A0A0K8V5Q2_BACLA|nr:PREDICTED: protein vestigial isoform X2 [Bactrocera latifrons]